MLRIKENLARNSIINFLIIIISVTYYSLSFTSPSSLGSDAFVSSAFGTSFFPGSFEQLYMVILSRLGVSLYNIYFSFAIVSLYLSLIGSYFFLRNIVILFQGRKQKSLQYSSNSLALSIVILFPSILLSMNPFFANNYSLGVGFIPFLTLSMATASEAIKFKIPDKRSVSLIFLTGFLLIFGYGGYILIPAYFAILFVAIIIPLSYRVVPLIRSITVLIISEMLFFVFSQASDFLIGSVSGSLGGLFPYFRPLNLEHEYALLSTSSLFKAITGLSFNVSFSLGIMHWIELFTMILIGTLLVTYLFIKPVTNKIKLSYLMMSLFIIILLSLPYNGDIPIIGVLPLYLISNHIVTYNHFGELLSLFDSNRFLLFLYWFLISATLAITMSFCEGYKTESGAIRNSHYTVIKKRKKIVFRFTVILACLSILVISSISISIGPFNYLNFEKTTPTYSYAIQNNSSYNRMLLYQDVNEFYPGNIYPSYMEMQADIPDKPMYVNFLNMESSPIVVPMLNTLPPASFIYSNNTERFLQGQALTNGYSNIENNNSNVTVGYPVFVMGSQYTFDQYIFHNYYNQTNTTLLNSQANLKENYGRFSYYSIPTYYMKALESKGGTIQVNTDIHILSAMQNGTGYTFGFSNQSLNYSQGHNQPSFAIGVFNSSSSSVLLGSGNPIIKDINYSEVLSMRNAYSYDLEKYIPLQGKNIDNISIIFYNSGVNGIYGFINYGGQWYQSTSNISLPQLKYFYSKANLDSPSGISYNVTISKLVKNRNYKNLIPIYYDSPFGNDTVLLNSIKYSNEIVEGKNYPISDLIGSLLVNSANSTLINPSAYSVQKPQDGWYQVFTDGAAQSSFSSECIPPVLDPPVFGYNVYTGYAQSVVENSTLTIPIGGNHSGSEYLDVNLLFSPAGGYLKITAGNNHYFIDTRSNSSYYNWVGINISGNIRNLTLRDVTGIQSINQVILTKVTSYDYFYNLASSLIRDKSSTSLSNLPQININSTSYKSNPVKYIANIALINHNNYNIIIEYSNPTYSGLHESSTNSDSFLLPSWASFPAVVIHNITGSSVRIRFFESKATYYSGYLPYVEFQGIWTPFLIGYIFKMRASKLIVRGRN